MRSKGLPALDLIYSRLLPEPRLGRTFRLVKTRSRSDKISLLGHALQVGGTRIPTKCVTKIEHAGLRYFPEPVFINIIFSINQITILLLCKRLEVNRKSQFRDQFTYFRLLLSKSVPSQFLLKGFQCKSIGTQATYLQKTIEIEQVCVPLLYLVGTVNHICRTPNALKTS